MSLRKAASSGDGAGGWACEQAVESAAIIINIRNRDFIGAGVLSAHREGDAVDDGAAQGDFVGILQIVADGDAARDGGHLHVGELLELSVNIYVRCVALHCGGQREDDLLDGLVADTLDELCDGEVVDADAVEGRDDPAENVVHAAVLLRVFDGHDLLYVLHNADNLLVAFGAGADGAYGCVADAVASAAEMRVLFQAGQGTDEGGEVAVGFVEQVQGLAESRTFAHSGEGGDFVDSVVQYFRRYFHHNAPITQRNAF